MTDILLIKNANIADPYNQDVIRGDILSENGLITRIGQDIPLPAGAEVINAEGLYASPGLIDLHTHLRDPGYEYKEDIISGTRAAAAGGFTSVLCMPNTKPVSDNAEVIDYIIKKAETQGYCSVYPIGAITAGQEGIYLRDFAALKEAGAAALSDDGRPVENAGLMREALLKAKESGMLVISHCEDLTLAGGVMHDGEVLKTLNTRRETQMKGIPGSAEDTITARDIILAGETGARLHVSHVSTAVSVKIIETAKKMNFSVTAETCPHYFALTDADVLKYGVNAKMNPPLRNDRDREAIIEGLCSGTIDCISTDHAPHSPEDKFESENRLERAANGIIGLESAFSLGITYLVKPGIITLMKLIELMSSNPAKIAGINGGCIRQGATADIILYDVEEKYTFNRETSFSKSRNTPFDGFELYGRIHYTVNRGIVRYRR